MPNKAAPRILIADDNTATRITIRELLKWHSFNVCGEAQDGDVAIEKALLLKPDIVVLDINMPRMNGVNAAHEIRRLRPKTKIVFLTIHDTPAVVAALRQWAHGCVCKTEAGINLVPTLNRVAGIQPFRNYKAPEVAVEPRAFASGLRVVR
jgi:DNA-binding NarL/FixJ family response regulator